MSAQARHRTLARRLRSRREEMEQAALARVRAIEDPARVPDSAYVPGLRTAVSVAFEYGLAAIEAPGEPCPIPPPELLTQARVAARNGVSLDTVLRRYSAGYVLLEGLVIEEVERTAAEAPGLGVVLRSLATRFDRLLEAVSEEYERERLCSPRSSAQRRVEKVRRLLGGELPDRTGLEYDFDAHHLGLIALGADPLKGLRSLAERLDRRLLAVPSEGGAIWAWLGGGTELDAEEAVARLREGVGAELRLAIGEPGQGMGGWRLTHRQAAAALTVAVRIDESVTRYAEVALIAAGLSDELLAISLRRLYLAPLKSAGEREGALLETLRAYFSAERNVSSTAAGLGVSRRTVNKRLRVVESRLGRPLHTIAIEVELALRIDELESGEPSNPFEAIGHSE